MKRTIRLLFIAVASLGLVACAGGPAVTPSPAASVVATATPTLAPTPTPTPSPTLQITTGTLTGTLSDGKQVPVSDAGLILCLQSATGCTTDGSLQATSDSSGQFEIANIPAGSYVVLFSLAGAPGSSAIDLAINFDDQTASCLGQGFTGSMPASCQGSLPFNDDQLTLGGGTVIGVSATGMTIKNGVITSPKYGLGLDFVDGKPLSVEITAGHSTDVQVTTSSAS